MADAFTELCMEMLSPLGPVRVRRMFGGQGVFKGGLMFGLIHDGELYFKVDDTNRADFEAKKSQPFSFEARARKIVLSYWFVPEDVIEDPAELKIWAAKAYAVALNNRKAEASRPKARRRALGQPARRAPEEDVGTEGDGVHL